MRMLQNNEVSFYSAHHRFNAKRRWRGFLIMFLVFIGEMKGYFQGNHPKCNETSQMIFFNFAETLTANSQNTLLFFTLIFCKDERNSTLMLTSVFSSMDK